MTRAALLSVVLASVACGSASPSPSAPGASGAAGLAVVGADPGDRLRDADGNLRPEATAGFYWQPYMTCDDCALPAALSAYVTDDVATARAVVRALDGRLPLGLPFVVHSEELMPGPARLVVVTGAFARAEDAERAAGASAPVAGVSPAVIAVQEYWADQPHHVTMIDRGGPVPAYTEADVRAVDEAMSASPDPDAQATLESERRWFARELHQRQPACTVLPGDLFVVLDTELDWYRLAPVRCGGQLAYVEWTSTLLGHAVVLPDGAGGHRLRQIVGAECDSAIIGEWRYDQRGRHPVEPEGGGEQLALGRC